MNESISDTIKRQLDEQLSLIQMQEKLNDGNTHDLTYINAVFIDGVACNSETLPVLLMGCKVNSYEEFNDAFLTMQMSWKHAIAKTDDLDLLALRACARAGLLMMQMIMNKVDTNCPKVFKAWEQFASVIGAASCARTQTELEHSIGLGENAQKIFSDFLASTEHPIFDDEPKEANS